ncbi:hypothetical protein GGR56DRAFT_667902 [Xylariaceae sp. FL0804]|nr:hypothetical protein GGR56DRAFT_667902 [Xylariaceae sp. FL0804]
MASSSTSSSLSPARQGQTSGGPVGHETAAPTATVTATATTAPATTAPETMAGEAPKPQQKRARVLLSCGPCRGSKLKCDRAEPCSQCLKKGRADACVYAPRREKPKPPKSMAARLKRLEGMVREMIDTEESNPPAAQQQARDAGGSVVRSKKALDYVGGTHSMAILEDLEDLKNYFEGRADESDDDEDDVVAVGDGEQQQQQHHQHHQNPSPPYGRSLGRPADVLLLVPAGAGTAGAAGLPPRGRDEMLALLPEKAVIERLMNRYFNSNSPSQHVIHIPTFTKQYSAFLQNPHETDLHWIATLFMVLALGVFFSSFNSPHELENDDSPVSAADRVKQYRGACGWALLGGKYTQPGPFTLPAFLLYVEGEFVLNRRSQMGCYLLCATLIRLMLKTGLHRDPGRLPGISPYDGEMRRRLWSLAVQIDGLVAFHLGLPCMIWGIESDTALPRNLLDSDFGEDSEELPPARPMTDYTSLTYPICKAHVSRAFILAGQMSNALTVPAYSEIMKVDAKITEAWAKVPQFMRAKPITECVTDPPMLVIQRFGLASLSQKSRCVLHRRYLVEVQPVKEHEYSRRVCVESAVALLDYQDAVHEVCQPGGMLHSNRWFIASLAVNDFLLADVVVAIAIQNESLDSTTQDKPVRTRDELIRLLRRSLGVWESMAPENPDYAKGAEVVQTMLRKIQAQFDLGTEDANAVSPEVGGTTTTASHRSDETWLSGLTIDSKSNPSSREPSSEQAMQDFVGFRMADAPDALPMGDGLQDLAASDPWGISQMQSGYNWDQFDAMARGPMDGVQPTAQIPDQPWLDQNIIDEFSEFLASQSWDPFVPDR